MYRLASNEPEWLDLFPGVRARFAPVSRKALRAAYAAARASLAQDPDAYEAASDALSAELLRRGLVGWEGVGDASGNKPLAFTPQAVEAFLSDPRLFAAAEKAYATPFLAWDAEKNVSSGSGNGTSVAPTPAKPTARPARKPAPTAPTKSTRR